MPARGSFTDLAPRRVPGGTRLSSGAHIAMMQSTDLRDGDHSAALGRLDAARNGSVTIQRQMRPRPVIIFKVFGEDALQVGFVDHEKKGTFWFSKKWNIRMSPFCPAWGGNHL